jgi:glycyl-tRNA synthetase beta chain
MERTSNILKGVKEKPADEVEQSLLENDLERKLYELLSSETQKISELARAERYQEATRLYGETFYKPLHDFFDKVLVNAEDLKIRSNRQALMKGIHQLYASRIADLALVQPLA